MALKLPLYSLAVVVVTLVYDFLPGFCTTIIHRLCGCAVTWLDGHMGWMVTWLDGLMGRMVSRVGCPDTLRLCLGVT